MSPNTWHVTFPAAGGSPLLEGILHLPGPLLGEGLLTKPFPAAIVCYPHPLMGGTMDNR